MKFPGKVSAARKLFGEQEAMQFSPREERRRQDDRVTAIVAGGNAARRNGAVKIISRPVSGAGTAMSEAFVLTAI